MTMIWIALLLAGQAETSTPTCVGSTDAIDCRAPDGSTYIERRIGSQVVRQGTDTNGQSWTEYVTPRFDGTRTEGVDSSGRSWARQCNPRFGTTGTDRSGQTVFVPPPHTVPTRDGEPTPNPCG